MGVSQPTISRTITVVTRIIAGALEHMLTTVEEVPHGGVYIIDGTLLPCRGLEEPDGPVVEQAQAHRPQPASTGQPGRAPAVCIRPPTRGYP